MSTKKITALTELSAAPAATDMIPIVDVSDTTDASSGTTKKITSANVHKAAGIGAGDTTAEPVKIDTSNGRVGVGTGSPASQLHISGTAPVIQLTDTDTGADSKVTASSGSGGLKLQADINDESDNSYINLWVDGSEKVRVLATGRVGIGTTSPDELLQVESTGASSAAIQIESTAADSYPSVRFVNDAREWRIYAPAGTISDGFQIYDHTATETRLFIDTAGNVMIGGTTTPTSSVGNLCLFNGTIPAASIANGVVLYAEDATGSSELKVRDEAGNVATLSPHNFDLLGERSDPMAWSYSSKNAFVGKEVAVDMMKVVRALEKLTGESYIKMKDLPKSEVLDWDAEEKRKEDEQKVEVSAYKTRKVDADKEKSDFDDKWGVLPTGSSTKAEIKSFLDEQEIDYEDAAKDELLTKVPKKPEFTESEPEVYVKKSKPDWM